MRPLILSRIVIVVAVVVATAATVGAQKAPTKKPKKAADTPHPGGLKPAPAPRFWPATTPLEATRTVTLKELRSIKVDSGPFVPATLSYTDSGSTVTLPVRLKARGHSRLKTCSSFPPVWVNF